MLGIRLPEVNLSHAPNNGVKPDYPKLIRLPKNRYDSYKPTNISMVSLFFFLLKFVAYNIKVAKAYIIMILRSS